MSDLAAIKDALAEGKLRHCLQLLDRHLAQSPDDVDAMYLQVVALRYAGAHGPALDAISRLKAIAPSHSRVHQEEGHLLRDLGKAEAALAAYGRGLALNPVLASCLRESIKLARKLKKVEQAAFLEMQLDQLLRLPKALVDTLELISQNKLAKAEVLCRRFLQHNPQHVQAMRLLADIGGRLGSLEDAEFLLESAAKFAPDDLQVRLEYVQILRKRQKFEAALVEAQALLKRYPDDRQVKSLCAIEHMQTGHYDRAISLLDEVLVQTPNDARTLVTYGHALKTCGRTAEAIDKYRQAKASQPEYGESYYSLANLKVFRFEDDEVLTMQELASGENLSLMDRVYLNFALGKAHEDRSEYETSFRYYAQGNALKKAQSNYDAGRMHDEMAATAALCDSDFFEQRREFGWADPAPIFIVGLPRAGSTLLEQILSSHSRVDGTLELPNILSLSQTLRRRANAGGYPQVLATLSAQECAEFGAKFIRDTQIHRADAPYFIDKMPNNFRHIGLIKLILPNAKIIDARREPMACCFSGFKQLFAEGQEFTYDLSDVGGYYRDYVNLMAHWDRVMPGSVLKVQHEDVVTDLEGEVRRLLEFCELPFEAGCLRYFETARNIRTPSSEQVRQPIFTNSLEQWRNYEPWLGELQQAIGHSRV